LASLAFYAYADLRSFAVISPFLALDYFIARALLQTPDSHRALRTLLLITGIIANVVFLAYFKYDNFIIDTINKTFNSQLELTEVLFPLGLSFLTFQKIALLADAYSNRLVKLPIRDYLLLLLLFPRVVAGPIVHYRELIPQFKIANQSNIRENLAVGITLFSIGLFKKAVIADNVGDLASPVFDTAAGSAPSLFSAWTAALAYTLQLYFDFSGYSDMAIGSARMFGIVLPMNFNSPFKSRSVIEFWSRWHISLTRFLTDYIYTPIVLQLTRARTTKGRSTLRGRRSTITAIATLVAAPTMITMIISGLWHGTGWQFVIWGAAHGTFLTINQIWRLSRARSSPPRTDRRSVVDSAYWMLTFLSLVLSFVVFRAPSVEAAFSMVRGMIGLNGLIHPYFEMLQDIDLPLPQGLLLLFHPPATCMWIAALLIVVMTFPNSLELLRRFRPALYFPEDASKQGLRSSVTKDIKECDIEPHSTERGPMKRLSRIKNSGIDITHMTAAATGIVLAVAVLALERSSNFIYFKF
jgi:D-alanyl-lipoteichoic acid acyltransferase DltB (MBOAT superfamily)